MDWSPAVASDFDLKIKTKQHQTNELEQIWDKVVEKYESGLFTKSITNFWTSF